MYASLCGRVQSVCVQLYAQLRTLVHACWSGGLCGTAAMLPHLSLSRCAGEGHIGHGNAVAVETVAGRERRPSGGIGGGGGSGGGSSTLSTRDQGLLDEA